MSYENHIYLEYNCHLNHLRDILLLALLIMNIPDGPVEGLGQWPNTTWGDYHNDVLER